MAEPKKCTDCGCDLPADAPRGHCPKCLIGLVHSALSGEIEPDGLEVMEAAVAFSPERPGQLIGRYKLLEKIGEGGCGAVYMAEQSEPVRRRVALKVIKAGMDTKEVLARFEAERQALAIMDHPNIAKIFEAGATDKGRPFFVMELVRGLRITEYCDQHNAPTKARLELFIQVCRAAQHAHEKGIIHRDIKPSNILVTLHDGIPVPKVIDFGIAKATTGQQLTDKTFFTAFERFVGTPAYMSPEQAEMSGLGIDARSDIYSLGVLLYELLTGRTPFDTRELIGAGVDAMRRIIREQEPIRPSTKISSLKAAEQTATARRRQTEPAKLIHLVRGDLDWIVMKCLEKDRQRRYESANGLALDVQRHLNHEVVTARAPSHFYRFRKSILRNKVPVAIVTCVVLSLLTVFGVTARLLSSIKKLGGIAAPVSSQAALIPASVKATEVPDQRHPQPLLPVVSAKTNSEASVSAQLADHSLIAPSLAPVDDRAAAEIFRADLAPYGKWMDLDGQTYWQPNEAVAATDWRPYLDNGRWAYTDAGWTWDSGYDWGWAAFHYGRWADDPVLGWLWQPDNVWAPAWVVWRADETYCGWAPLPPGAVYTANIEFRYRGVEVPSDFGFDLAAAEYCFIGIADLCSVNYKELLVAPARLKTVFQHAPIIQNAITTRGGRLIEDGVAVARVRELTHRDFAPLRLIEADTRTPGTDHTGAYVVRRAAQRALADVRPAAENTDRILDDLIHTDRADSRSLAGKTIDDLLSSSHPLPSQLLGPAPIVHAPASPAEIARSESITRTAPTIHPVVSAVSQENHPLIRPATPPEGKFPIVSPTSRETFPAASGPNRTGTKEQPIHPVVGPLPERTSPGRVMPTESVRPILPRRPLIEPTQRPGESPPEKRVPSTTP